MSQADVQAWIERGELRRAASSLVVAYGSDVLSTCIAMVRDRAAAEDVTQEVFGDAVRALATFRGESSPRTWLLSIARNRCIDYLRARKRDPWGRAGGAGGALDEREADPDAHPDHLAEGGEWLADRSLVARGLDALAEGDRALIVLRFRNGLEYGELASAFGLREGTVRMRVSRALARMRDVLESEVAAPVTPAAPAQAAPARGMPAMPQAAARTRAAAPPPVPAAGAVGGASFGAPPPARAPQSWWARLRAWAGLGPGADIVATHPRRPDPVGTLGLALAEMGPIQPSEALAARLGALVSDLARPEGEAPR